MSQKDFWKDAHHGLRYRYGNDAMTTEATDMKQYKLTVRVPNPFAAVDTNKHYHFTHHVAAENAAGAEEVVADWYRRNGREFTIVRLVLIEE